MFMKMDETVAQSCQEFNSKPIMNILLAQGFNYEV